MSLDLVQAKDKAKRLRVTVKALRKENEALQAKLKTRSKGKCKMTVQSFVSSQGTRGIEPTEFKRLPSR